MPPWLSHIISAQKKEGNLGSARWVQLATIASDSSPRVRTVVFRGWSDSYELEILTDKRSQKYKEIELNNNVEICWFFLRSKCQFRLRGTARIDLGNDKNHFWQELSKKAKSMWGWPNPGELFEEEQNNKLISKENINKYDNFILLKIRITQVEKLLLEKPLHIRKRWIRQKDWLEERINP